jgi:uncharacterized phage protein gp47/JayE
VILTKTFDELMDESLGLISASNIITNISPGAAVRLILEAVNQNVADYYTVLDISIANLFLSSANGIYLDLIGYTFNCERGDGELDDDYRYRISQQIYVAASANETAVRLAALSADGIRDVVISEYTYGTGSFSILVIPEDIAELDSVVPNVQEAVNSIKAKGIKSDVFGPTLIPVDINIQLINNNLSIDDDVKEEVVTAIDMYLREIRPGRSMIINELTQRIMEVSDNIEDYEWIDLKVNNSPSLIANITLKDDEMFKPQSIIVN